MSVLRKATSAAFCVGVRFRRYIPKEGFGVRLEDDVIVTPDGPVNLMANTPVAAEEIEDLMNR